MNPRAFLLILALSTTGTLPAGTPTDDTLTDVAALEHSESVASESVASSESKPPPPQPAPKPCCPAPRVENRESKIENLSAASLYQLDAAFTTDAGTRFTLGELRGRPVIVTMFFASCTYACPLIVADLTRVRDSLPADVRDRAALVLVSFDPARDTPAALRKYREDRLLDDQWILLHAAPDTVRELAALLGVKYKQEADGQFAHSNLFTVLNPAGEIVHQRAGLTGGLLEAAAALTRAARP